MSPHYPKAQQFLQQHPTAGKGRLAHHLGIRTPAARLLIERHRGETQGHRTDPDYQRVRQAKSAQPNLGSHGLARQLGLTVDKARLYLARYAGALVFHGPNLTTLFPPLPPAAVPAAAAPPSSSGAALQDNLRQDARDLDYVGHHVTTVEELLLHAQVDQSVWEVERQTINKWDVGAKDPLSGTVLTTPLFQNKVWLRRRVVEQRLEALMQGLLAQFQAAAPAARVVPCPPARDGLYEISILDLHLGKYPGSVWRSRGSCHSSQGPRIGGPGAAGLLQVS